ncbi:hypothetical protein GOP47_0022448 [Adiantum capillus-veneris]|uniref:Uncharacterized protein n=1 Tax=Adiantum capillus-veneris TaxID=13818 RepID=A0A9D4U5C7_ADICA|nr:hypothetical protein GOP47_0022448 [Adiantum capillus-veneris]
MLRGLFNQARSRKLPVCTEQALTYRCIYEPTIATNANCNHWHQSTAASALCTPPAICLHNVFHSCSNVDHSTRKSNYFVDPSSVLTLGKAGKTYSSSSNVKESRSESEGETNPKDASTQPDNHEEMVGSGADVEVPPLWVQST